MRAEGTLTPAQHEIMEIVWEVGDAGASVTEIWESIAETRTLTRTTVLNQVDRLEKRGWLQRVASQGANRYQATSGRDETAQYLASEFVEDFFGGSASELVASLLGSKSLDAKEVKRLRDLLNSRRSSKGSQS